MELSEQEEAALAAAMPSDVEAALQVLFADVPAGLRLCNGLLPLITVAQVYALVRDRTEVDHTVEELRASGKLRIAQLGPRRSEFLLARTADCDAVLRNSQSMQHSHPPTEGFVLTSDIATVMNDPSIRPLNSAPPQAVEVAHRLMDLGWLRPSRAATGAGPNEAPVAEGEEWMWSFPDSGSLVNGLLQVRHKVLSTLKRQRLGRAPLHFVEKSTKSMLRATKVDLRYVLRDMEGLELIVTEQPGLRGCALFLTPQGQQEVAAASTKGRKRQR